MAGPLFDISTRMFNLKLAESLSVLFENDATLVLPQEEAKNFFEGGAFDMIACSKRCAEQSVTSDVVLLNLDGPDTDSGTALEAGLALYQKLFPSDPSKSHPIVIAYRTDFRTDLVREVGINGMFNLADHLIYKPAFATTGEEIETFLDELASEIWASINHFLNVAK